MQKSNFYIWFGLWVAILPFLGVPNIWKIYLTTLSGIFLMLHAASPIILKKLQSKPSKPKRKPTKLSTKEIEPQQSNPDLPTIEKEADKEELRFNNESRDE